MKKFYFVTLLLFITSFKSAAEDVSISVNGYKISGTLEVPVSKQPMQVALIISGSGPTDRDGNNPIIPGKNNSLKMVADLLYNNGIASLRYDKRGVGVNEKVNESELTFSRYIDDAVEWIKYLKNDKRFSKIIVIGHSEGALIGMIASERINIDKYISLCGDSKPGYITLEKQLKDSKLPQESLNYCKMILDSLKIGCMVRNIKPSYSILFRESVQPYLISYFKYNPVKEISKLTIPILIVGGTTDIQIGSKEAESLSIANTNAKLKIIENMNHLLKEVKTTDRSTNIKSYSNPDLPLSKIFSNDLLEFVRQQ